jgi:hypothetical protein
MIPNEGQGGSGAATGSIEASGVRRRLSRLRGYFPSLQVMSGFCVVCCGIFVMTLWVSLWCTLWGSGDEYAHTPFLPVLSQHQALLDC